MKSLYRIIKPVLPIAMAAGIAFGYQDADRAVYYPVKMPHSEGYYPIPHQKVWEIQLQPGDTFYKWAASEKWKSSYPRSVELLERVFKYLNPGIGQVDKLKAGNVVRLVDFDQDGRIMGRELDQHGTKPSVEEIVERVHRDTRPKEQNHNSTY